VASAKGRFTGHIAGKTAFSNQNAGQEANESS
jgi:hypothetical protein